MESDSLKPRYEQMFMYLKGQILNGEFEVGERIPSEKELMEQFSVSRITSKKALDMLMQDGYIMRQPGRGSFVIPREKAAAEQGAASPAVSREGRIVLGLIMEDFSDSYGKEMLVEMEKTAQELGIYLMLRLSFSRPDIEEKAIQALKDYGVDGLIIYPTRGQNFSPEILKLVINRFPHILIDRYLKGTDTTAISTDNVEAGRAGTEYLLDLQHKHIGMLASRVTDNVAIEERMEGFVRAHAERGVVLDRSLWLTDMMSTPDDDSPEASVENKIALVQQMLRDHPEVTALFAMEYELALIAKEAVEKLGLHIPEQISILCFDSPRHSVALYPFTHLQQNQKQFGKLAVNYVLELIHGRPVPSKISLPAELILGDSTGAPPSCGR